MKKNAAQREFKKLKSQINQIEEIVQNSKQEHLFEHETSIRKKIRRLKKWIIKDLKILMRYLERYEEF